MKTSSAGQSSDGSPWVLLAAILGSSMVFVDGTVVNLALPALQAAFHASGATLQWIIEAYVLALSSFLLLGGSFGDLYGRKRMFAFGVILFASASVLCGFAFAPEMIIASRALQGLGGALLVPGSLALISASFPEETRGRAIGVWSGATAVSAALGPVVGGWLIQHVSWRWIFFLNVPIALLVLAVCVWRIAEQRDPRSSHPDWIGAGLAAGGLGTVTFALVEGTDRTVPYLPVLVSGMLMIVGFLIREAHADYPMLPLELFRSRAFSISNAITFLVYAALTGAFFYLPQQLIQIEHYSAAHAGLVLLPMTIFIATLSKWMGNLVQRIGPRPLLVLGALLSSFGYAVLAIHEPGGSYIWTVLPAVLLLGAGLAVLVAPLTTTVMSSISRERSGIASGTNNAISNIASLLAIAILGRVFTKSFDSHLRANLSASALPLHVREAILTHHHELGGIVAVGEGRRIVDQSFVASFHVLLFICCLLTVSAGLLALFLGKCSRSESV